MTHEDCPGSCTSAEEHETVCVRHMLAMSWLPGQELRPEERNTGARLTLIDTAKIEAKDAEIFAWKIALHKLLPNEPTPHRDANAPSGLTPKDIGAAIDVYRKDNERLRAALRHIKESASSSRSDSLITRGIVDYARAALRGDE